MEKKRRGQEPGDSEQNSGVVKGKQEPWRLFLKNVLRDRQIQLKLEEVTTLRTMMRWVSGEGVPTGHSFQQVADRLPSRLRREFIQLVKETQPDVVFTQNTDRFFIPSEYFIRFISSAAEAAEPVRKFTLTHMAGVELLSLLQNDEEAFPCALLLATCVMSSDQTITTVHIEVLESGAGILPHHIYKFSSLQGEPVLDRLILETAQAYRPLVINDREQYGYAFQTLRVESLAIFPLCRFGRVAGCLLVLSSQAGVFHEARYDLLNSYRHLFALAYKDNEFFAPESIHVKKSESVQKENHDRCITVFAERVRLLTSQSLSPAQAEQQALDELEQLWQSVPKQQEET